MGNNLRPVMGGPPSLPGDDGVPFDVAVAPEELPDVSSLAPTPGCQQCTDGRRLCPACAKIVLARRVLAQG